MSDSRTKYNQAIKLCDEAWDAYEQSGFETGKAEFKAAYAAKVMRFAEYRKTPITKVD